MTDQPRCPDCAGPRHQEHDPFGDEAVACLERQLSALTPLLLAAVEQARAYQAWIDFDCATMSARDCDVLHEAFDNACDATTEAVRALPPEIRARLEFLRSEDL